MLRSLLAAPVLALLAVSLTACTTTATPSATPSTVSSPSTSPSTAGCALAPTSTLTAPGAGSVIVELTNAGSATCTFQGHATVTLLDQAGKAIALTLREGDGEQFSGDPVAVRPGGHAYLTLLTNATPGCPSVGAARAVIGISGAENTTTVDLGSHAFCAAAGDDAPASYPVTTRPTTLS